MAVAAAVVTAMAAMAMAAMAATAMTALAAMAAMAVTAMAAWCYGTSVYGRRSSAPSTRSPVETRPSISPN